MKFIVKCFDYYDCKRVLTGFEYGVPTYVKNGQLKRGAKAMEFTTQDSAIDMVNKIKRLDKWRHYEIVGICD